jgi:hypothetical protein
MFFRNKKKEYRGRVVALLPMMDIPDFDSIGQFVVYDQIDACYHNGFTEYEAVLAFAYSCIPKLAAKDMSSAKNLYEKTAKKQDKWLEIGSARQDIVREFKALTKVHLT